MSTTRNRRLGLVLFAVVSASQAMAAGEPEMRYRYKDILWDGSGKPIIEVGGGEEESFECLEPSGVYGASRFARFDETSCFYDDPTVAVGAATPAMQQTVSLDQWCGDVLDGSHAKLSAEMVARQSGAEWSGAWSTRGAVAVSGTVVCTTDPGAPHVPESPPERAGTLKNADFEDYSSYSPVGWEGRWVRGVDNPDPDMDYNGRAVTGNGSGDNNTIVQQDVAVDPSLIGASFPVSVEWLQFKTRDWSGNTADVILEYLDGGGAVIGSEAEGPKEPDLVGVVIRRGFESVAPAGTAAVRVKVHLVSSRAAVDNVALRIDGVDVSEINGGFGMPVDLPDFVKDGAANSVATWITDTNYVYSRVPPEDLEDAGGFVGSKVFSTGNYGDTTVFQQLWLPPDVGGKAAVLRWQQGRRDGGGSSPKLGSVDFYTAEGSKLGELKGADFAPVLQFWQNLRVAGSVPAGADFALVKMHIPNSEYRTDNLSLTIGGSPLTSMSAAGPPEHFEYCPRYVDTVDGPSDNRWQLGYSLGVTSEFHAYPQAGAHGGEYKAYCVDPARDKYLLAYYDIDTDRGFGGFAYTFYDLDGNEISERITRHQSGRWGSESRVIEAVRVPAEAAILMKTFRASPHNTTGNTMHDHYATHQFQVYVRDVNFIMNGSLDEVAANLPGDGEGTVLRNGAADSGTRHWSVVPGSGGVLAVDNVRAITAPSGGPVDVRRDGEAAAIEMDCGAEACVHELLPEDWAFHSELGSGDFYQDVVIAGYDLAAGTSMKLEWRMGGDAVAPSVTTKTDPNDGSESQVLTANWNEAEYGVRMGLEFYDADGNLVGSSYATETNPNLYLQFDFDRELVAQLPADAFSVRVLMGDMRADRVMIDDIRLSAGTMRLSRPD